MLNTKQREVEIAKELLSINAVKLSPTQPFVWPNGQVAPVDCNNRLTLSYPEIRSGMSLGLAETISFEYPECEGVFGTSTAAIAHAALVADRLKLPMGYVKIANKKSEKNRIEGIVQKGQKIVVIEDLIFTGQSVIEVVKTLREAGAEVLGIASIFTYGLKEATELMQKENVRNEPLCTFKTLAEVAVREEIISKKEYNMILAFQSYPYDDNWQGVQL